MTMNNNFLNNLLNSISVSGYEEQVQDIVEEEMKDYVDEVRRDEMQNVTCVINPILELCYQRMQMKLVL